jgi:two-component system cell cycle sensor histidine kinase/response regulator CckA
MLRVLYSDDEELILSTAKLVIECMGLLFVGASDNAEATHLFREAVACGRPFSLVILDLTARAGDGAVKTLATLTKIDPNVRAIVCSGYGNSPILHEDLKYGFVGALSKPFSVEKLYTSIFRSLRPPPGS